MSQPDTPEGLGQWVRGEDGPDYLSEPEALAEKVRGEIGVAHFHKDGSHYPGADEARDALNALLALANSNAVWFRELHGRKELERERAEAAEADRDRYKAELEQIDKFRTRLIVDGFAHIATILDRALRPRPTSIRAHIDGE